MKIIEEGVTGVALAGTVLLVAIACSPDAEPVGDPRPPVLSAEELAGGLALARFGDEDAEDPFALLSSVQDGVLTGSEVALLDGDPPWIRVYGLDGGFRRGLVPRGEGPGELASPPIAMTRSAWEEERLILTHQRQGTAVSMDGGYDWSFRDAAYLLRWLGPLCEAHVLALAREIGSPGTPGLLLRMEAGEPQAPPDTLAILGALRDAPRATLPPFAHVSDSGVVLYTEERDAPRLLEVGCEGSVRAEFQLDSLGLPERFDTGPDGTGIALYPAEPPFPAGVVRFGDVTLWAIQQEVSEGGRIDSVTVVQQVTTDGPQQEAWIEGWYSLLDADSDGRLLMAARAPVSHGLLVPGARLMEHARAR